MWAVHSADPEESKRRGFLERAYPRLVSWHAYLQNRRDRGGRGLVSIVHPWESGSDNSPMWDDALSRVSDQPRDPFPRPDLLHAGSGERPGNREYAKYYWLAERYRDHDCDDVDADYPFLFEDPLFNTLYAVSELALGLIADEQGFDGSPHRARSAEISAALNGLWRQDLGLYSARDVVTGQIVAKATINGTTPLLLPGVAHADDAAAIGAALAQTARLKNFPEYVNPWTGTPHGTHRFSWTAALAPDAERRRSWTLFG